MYSTQRHLAYWQKLLGLVNCVTTATHTHGTFLVTTARLDENQPKFEIWLSWDAWKTAISRSRNDYPFATFESSLHSRKSVSPKRHNTIWQPYEQPLLLLKYSPMRSVIHTSVVVHWSPCESVQNQIKCRITRNRFGESGVMKSQLKAIVYFRMCHRNVIKNFNSSLGALHLQRLCNYKTGDACCFELRNEWPRIVAWMFSDRAESWSPRRSKSDRQIAAPFGRPSGQRSLGGQSIQRPLYLLNFICTLLNSE